jgi:hypothetical protein
LNLNATLDVVVDKRRSPHGDQVDVEGDVHVQVHVEVKVNALTDWDWN